MDAGDREQGGSEEQHEREHPLALSIRLGHPEETDSDDQIEDRPERRRCVAAVAGEARTAEKLSRNGEKRAEPDPLNP